MAPSNLPSIFNATSQDIEMLLAAQCHLGSKNLQVHMEPYLWKTRPDGINVINIGKTWYYSTTRICVLNTANQIVVSGRKSSSQLASSPQLTTPPISPSSLPAHTVNVLSSSLPLIPVLLPLLDVSPLETSPTTSPAHSKNLALSSLPILVPMLKLSKKLPT